MNLHFTKNPCVYISICLNNSNLTKVSVVINVDVFPGRLLRCKINDQHTNTL